MSWARLLKRIFNIAIELCPNCGGALFLADNMLPAYSRCDDVGDVKLFALSFENCGAGLRRPSPSPLPQKRARVRQNSSERKRPRPVRWEMVRVRAISFSVGERKLMNHFLVTNVRSRRTRSTRRFNHRFNHFFCFSAFASASSKTASTGFMSVHSTWLSRSR
jgi:hypothetical protein